MTELTNNQLERQDFIDNSIYELIKSVNPTNLEIDWDIEMIGSIRDVIEKFFLDKKIIADEQQFYPFIA